MKVETGAVETPIQTTSMADTTGADAVSAEARDASAFNSLAQHLSAWTETPPAPKQEPAKDSSRVTEVPSHPETTEAPSAEGEAAQAEPAEAAAPEPEAEPEAQAEETVAEPEAGWTPEQQKAFDRRVGKEVVKRKVLEERIAALESQAQAKPEPAAPTAPAPIPAEAGGLAAVKTEAELHQLSTLANRVLDAVDGQIAELQDNPEQVEQWLKERGVTEAEIGGEFTVGKMHKHLLKQRASADRVLREAPLRQSYLRNEAANRKQVQADPSVAWVLNPNDHRQAHVQTVYAQFPNVRAFPDHLELVAAITDALLARQKAKSAPPVKAAAAPKPPPPKPPGRTSAAPALPAAAQITGAVADSRFRKSRNLSDLAEALA